MADKLRIAFVTPEFVTETHFDGGLSNYLYRVSKSLASLGHDVHVVTLSQKNEDDFVYEGVKIHRVLLSPRWQLFNRLSRYKFTTSLHWLNFSAQAYRKLKELHRQTPFQLIQYPNYSSCGLFSIPLLRATHVVRASSFGPILNHAAGVKRTLDSSLTERLEAYQYKLTPHISVPSQSMQEQLAEHLNVREARLIRSPFYVETTDWDATVREQYLNAGKYLLYFGRFQVHKGFHTLVRALPRFLNECPDACVALVGRDMETRIAPSMTAYARAECGSNAKRLIFLENLPHRQLYPVIAGAHLVVLPSLIDNLPNACLEAMGLGKVVIGTAGTSFEELITDGVNGFLVPRDNPESLAEKMISAWSNPNLEAIGSAAKQEMLRFAPEKTVAPLLSYYVEVLTTANNR